MRRRQSGAEINTVEKQRRPHKVMNSMTAKCRRAAFNGGENLINARPALVN